MYGLMSVFGNGVIDGWTVLAEERFTISISEGYGNINFIAARTTFPTIIRNIPPNSVNYVYARLKERTTYAEDVEFILSPANNLNDLNFLLIAEIVTGALSIETIDNSLRQEIAFLELIKAAIRLHKHRGGSLNPSKIDLASEVKGQLPSFRIADFDAEKITTGTFDLARMPLLDHQELENVGLLTHPQLDTFVKTLEASNKEIFGEIGTAILLQLIIAMKFIHDDPESAFYFAGQDFDQYMINELAVIPGITPNTSIDFDNTTATVDLEQHYIRGIPPTTGTSFYVTYNTNLAWNAAHSIENLVVSNDTVTLSFTDDEEANIVTLEGFETATEPGEDLSGGSQTLFTKQTIVLSDDAHILANSSATNVVEGFYSGKFTHRQSFRSQYVKEYSEAQDWSTYDTFVLHIKCISANHKSVRLYFEDSQGNTTTEYIILQEDEVTENDDTTANDFEMREIDLSAITFRNDIKKFVIFSDDLENPFEFYIDYINIQRAVLLPEEGTLKIRYSSSTNVTFSSLEWSTLEPTGTEILVRARSASGTVLLVRADYTPYLNSGDNLNLEGTDIEIEITFTPDENRLQSPVLQELRILVLTEAEIDGFVINSVEELSRGESKNVTINSSPTSVTLTPPVRVGSYFYCLSSFVNQLKEDTTSQGSSFASSEFMVDGMNTPIAPNRVFKAIEEDASATVTTASLFEPRSVRRTTSRSLIVADTYNDRVLEFDEDGDLLSGVGSINYEHSSKIFPIAASVDIRTSILYIVWSKPVSFKTVNVSKITLKTTSTQIQIIRDFDKIMGLTTSELETVDAQGQIMPIHLSAQNAGLVLQLPTTGSYMLASFDVIPTEIDTDSVFYEAIATVNGIPLFVGNFAYIDGIFTPTWAEKTDSDSFIISNGNVAVKEHDFPSGISESISRSTTVSNIIEVDENNNVVFGSNVIAFSPFIPGRAERIDTNTLLLAGLKPGVEGSPTSSNPFDFRSISGTDEEKQQQKSVLNQIFFGGTTPFVGAVVVYDTRAGATTFEYLSAEGILVSDVDVDPQTGTYVVAESSLEKSGRIIKLDAVGNITFSYGEGLFSLINDVEVQIDGSMVIST